MLASTPPASKTTETTTHPQASKPPGTRAIALFHALSGSGAVACVHETTALAIGPFVDFHDKLCLKELRDAGVDDAVIRVGQLKIIFNF